MRSLLHSSSAIWKSFYQSACCHMQEDSSQHENVGLCKMQEVTDHELCYPQGAVKVCVLS